MRIELCHWCNNPTANFCKQCDKAYCAVKCLDAKREERNPAQPCAVNKSAVAKSKALAAAGY
jgi:hypothetical protein